MSKFSAWCSYKVVLIKKKSVDDNFKTCWNNELSRTNDRLVTILKEEHLRLALDFQSQFWTLFPDAISSGDEPALKKWLTSMLAILDRDYKKWSAVCHKKIARQCPDFIERCRNFTPSAQLSIESDLRYVTEAFHARSNRINITTRSKQRKKKTNVSAVGEDIIDNLVFNSDVFSEDFNIINILETGEHTSNDVSPVDSNMGMGSNTASEGEGTNSRLDGKFVSDNVINLSKKVLTEAQIKVLSKGLKFCPTPKEIDRAKVMEDLENFGRRLRLKWYFRNEEEGFSTNPFKKKSTFNPKQDVAIEFS